MTNTTHGQYGIEHAHTHITHSETRYLIYKKKILGFGEQLALRLRDRKGKSDILMCASSLLVIMKGPWWEASREDIA